MKKNEQIKKLKDTIKNTKKQMDGLNAKLNHAWWQLIELTQPVDPNEPDIQICRQDYIKKKKK